jgi:hypothetical protein
MRYWFFWKGMEDISFKRTEQGMLFFPYGALGSGYVVDEQSEKLRAFIRRFYFLATILLFVGILGTWLIALPSLVPLVIYYYVGIRRQLAGAPISGERLGFGEAYENAARTMSMGRLMFVMLAGIAMSAASLFVLWFGLRSGDQRSIIIGIAGAVLCGLSALFIGYITRLKRRIDRT